MGKRNRSRLDKERVHVSQWRIQPSPTNSADIRRRPQGSGRGKVLSPTIVAPLTLPPPFLDSASSAAGAEHCARSADLEPDHRTRAGRYWTAPAASTSIVAGATLLWCLRAPHCANRPIGGAVIEARTSTADLRSAPLIGTEIDVKPHRVQTEQGTNGAATNDLDDIRLRGVGPFVDKE